MNEKEFAEISDYYRIQQLLYREAQLLDGWQLKEWLELYTDDARYLVPPTNVPADEADPTRHLYYIADNRPRLEERVIRLGKKTCHSEYPRSKVQHIVGNILINETEGDYKKVTASFVVYRSKGGNTDTFMGNYDYRLVDQAGEIKIKSKTCHLALDGLRPQAKISIIL